MRAAVLADAGVEALAELFPRWRIWADMETGWHACRRGGFIQDYHPDARPSRCTRERPGNSPASCAGRKKTEKHTPFGCSRR